MVCYIIPLVAAIITSTIWGAQRRGPAGWWLMLLLCGGAVFGVVDHLLYGELLLFSPGALPMDLFVGGAITTAIFGGWGITLGIAKMYPDLSRRMGYRMGILRSSEKR